MTDALSVVRQATIEKVPIKFEDGNYIIGSHKFPESVKTIFKRTLKSDDYHYTLKDIIFFLENSSLTVAEYRRRAVESRITAVVEQDRHALQQYLTGVIESCPQLDLLALQAMNAENVQSSKENKIKKDSNKRKHAALQSSDTTENVDSEDSVALQQIRADEYAPFNRLTVLNAVGTDFAIALKLFNDRILKPKDVDVPRQPEPSHSQTKRAESKRNPIIIVPSALTSTITMYNARQFFEAGTLVQYNEMPAQKSKWEFVKREAASSGGVNPTTSATTYKVIDDPSKLTIDEWDHVVVAFVTGQLWQFKGWKYDNPAELFQNILGIHLMYDDQQPPPTIQSWNCKILKVNKYKQHLNAGALREFWMLVDEFSRLKKSRT